MHASAIAQTRRLPAAVLLCQSNRNARRVRSASRGHDRDVTLTAVVASRDHLAA